MREWGEHDYYIALKTVYKYNSFAQEPGQFELEKGQGIAEPKCTQEWRAPEEEQAHNHDHESQT